MQVLLCSFHNRAQHSLLVQIFPDLQFYWLRTNYVTKLPWNRAKLTFLHSGFSLWVAFCPLLSYIRWACHEFHVQKYPTGKGIHSCTEIWDWYLCHFTRSYGFNFSSHFRNFKKHCPFKILTLWTYLDNHEIIWATSHDRLGTWTKGNWSER